MKLNRANTIFRLKFFKFVHFTGYMKSTNVFVLIVVLLHSHVFSQTDTTKLSKNIIYGEVFGAGGYGSINYERIFYTNNRVSVSARIGLGTYHIKDFTGKFNPDLLVPLAINGFHGFEHRAEFGIGQTISSIVEADIENLDPSRKTCYSTFFNAGYRYQKMGSGLFLRIAYTPIIENNKRWINWGGFSIGCNF